MRLCTGLLLATVTILPAQRLDPVKWTLEIKPAKVPPGTAFTARLAARMDSGWHLYSLTTPKGGANPTTIRLAPHPAIESVQVYQPKPVRKFDPNFQLDTETFDGEAVFLLAVRLKSDAPEGPAELTAQVRYQACTETQCLNPTRRSASATLAVDAAAPAPPALVVPAGYSEVPKEAPAAAAVRTSPSAEAPAREEGLGAFLLVAFGFGLAAIFTPCVFPMIPITMSFFLNQPNATRAAAVRQSVVFCLGIVVLFTTLGAVLTAALGPFGVVQLGSNPWVNGFIAAVFFAFGLSLLGAFEMALPSGLLTKLDQVSQRGGFAGTLLMGLTFSLTSFACVGPFMGSLLAASVQGGLGRPVIGMATFATGLSLPFFALSLFPGWLKRLPRSGGWLARVKIVMGFIVLAAMLKYAANVDQVLQAGWLTRERILALWLVLFGLAGFYLLGMLRLPGIRADEELGVSRLLIASAFLGFAISLVPGMFGARLGEVEAFLPPPSEGFAVAGAERQGSGLVWMKNQYQEALAKARQEGKLLFVSFTGYACSNCHWMKANMFPRPEIAAAMKDFVLVELYTDGADAASEANQSFQETRFGTVAIPYYVLLDGDEKVVAVFASLTRNPARFLAFLQQRGARA